MQPIPKSLLIHKASIKGIKSTDIWGVENCSPFIELKYVRFEPYKRIIRDKSNNEIQSNTQMFYDCRNSRPKNQGFNTDTIISINGEEKRVISVEEHYDNRKLHHLEIILA
jgi:hypothetical protein